MNRTSSLAASTALVTGSSKGIGRAIALGLADAGAQVVFHGNTPRPEDIPAGASYVQCDLSIPGAPDGLIAAALREKPALDLLVCNAGCFCEKDFFEVTPAEWEHIMDLNVRSVYFLVQGFARTLAAQKRPGAVVIVSSINGLQSEESTTAYDISKGALVMMTRTLAHALAPHNIRVNGIAPGLVRTPLTAPWIDTMPDKRRHYEKKILLKRIGEPEDCAGPVAFLLSQAASYITGQVIVVDGGMTVSQIGDM